MQSVNVVLRTRLEENLYSLNKYKVLCVSIILYVLINDFWFDLILCGHCRGHVSITLLYRLVIHKIMRKFITNDIEYTNLTYAQYFFSLLIYLSSIEHFSCLTFSDMFKMSGCEITLL
jgi:hypothetical protein